MPKEKKISFVFNLNKNAKSDIEGTYAVYLRINFNRQTTNIKPLKDWDIKFSESDFEEFESGVYIHKDVEQKAALLETVKTPIEKIIRKEYERHSGFSLRGMGQILDAYQKKVVEVLRESLVIEFEGLLADYLTANDYKFVMSSDDPVHMFYRASEKTKESIDKVLTDRLRLFFTAYASYSLYFDEVSVEKVSQGGYNPFDFSVYAWLLENDPGEFYFYLKGEKYKNNSEPLASFYKVDNNNYNRVKDLIFNELKKFIQFSRSGD